VKENSNAVHLEPARHFISIIFEVLKPCYKYVLLAGPVQAGPDPLPLGQTQQHGLRAHRQQGEVSTDHCTGGTEHCQL
jgi:hypothetical protein